MKIDDITINRLKKCSACHNPAGLVFEKIRKLPRVLQRMTMHTRNCQVYMDVHYINIMYIMLIQNISIVILLSHVDRNMHKRRLHGRRNVANTQLKSSLFMRILSYSLTYGYYILRIWKPLLKYLNIFKRKIDRQIILSLVRAGLPAHRPRSGFQPFWYLFVKYLQWYIIYDTALVSMYNNMFSSCVFVYNTTVIIVLTKTGSSTDRQ